MKYRKATVADYPILAEVWQRSVTASHHFLTPEDIAAIKKQLPEYFAAVELLVWCDGEQIIGFTGTTADDLAMFFLDEQFIGGGYGSKIITRLLNDFAIRKVAVNEDNPRALHFYQKHGFKIVKRTATDDAGRPFPILYLEQ